MIKKLLATIFICIMALSTGIVSFAANDLVAYTANTRLAYVQGEKIGDFTIFAYCPCTKCCGSYANGMTATGVQATANRTIAVDPSVIPLGTTVIINGKTYVAEDVGGGINGYKIDMFFNTHAEALAWGMRTLPIYTAVSAGCPFVDNLEGDFYYDPVIWAYESGITSGTSNTTFSPEASCTRGQVVTFLHRVEGKPVPSSNSNPFTDVDISAFYGTPVLWAVGEEITKGISATKFGPDQTVTRGQFVAFLWRAAGKPEPTTTTNPFSDVEEDAFYYKAVLWAVENGVTSGVGNGRFAPEDNCTRGQVVTFLYRAYVE